MSTFNLLDVISLQYYLTLTIRLVVACVLGGIIGYERESMNRPAGFRTHILVCVGSALVMITSEFLFKRYSGLANIDPGRLGAQVISGIGFLGAGTIIREGFNVRGLTTAASLWAVSCVGIAVGIGFYEGAVVATLLIYITLIFLKKMEGHFLKKNQFRAVFIQSCNTPGVIGEISNILGKHNILIKNIEFINNEGDKNILLKYVIKLPHNMTKVNVMSDLLSIEGIQKVYED